MLILNLMLDNGQVAVRSNESPSHSFSIHDLRLNDAGLKAFVHDPRLYGANLFQALFKDGSAARMAFDKLSKQSEQSIILVLESPELDGIAWEYAYHDTAYLVEDFAFIRTLPEKERPHSNGGMSKSVERMPLLFIPANPLVDLSGKPMRELDIESEWREMTQHIVKSNAPFDLIELRPATPAALQSMMARFQNGMIAHFSGHGVAAKDGAFLLFENENGSSNPLEAREFVREVKDQAWIGFLSACQSAVAEKTEYSNLARELVKAGVPFALGMQFNLPDPFAPNISGQFYNYLSQGHAVPEAARQARRAVKRENEFYVGMIALYAALPDEAGKMGWYGSGARTVPTFAGADVSDLPTPSGFIGRQRELMNIGTKLLGKKKPSTVTLHGAGGIGKTALMRQALLRFAPLFESTLAIALDPLPSLESVLGRMERFLNLPSPCSNDTKERERIVRERLTSKRTLLGLDNFETLNYALNENGSDEEQTAKSLHSFFKYLTANGVTLCVTSREVTNLGGETIEEIYGLTNESGGRLFQNNVVRQKDEIYIEKTQQVSEMVGGHPLALRLLASAFDDQVGTSLDEYIEELQTHLPKAHDKWTEEDRHESLRACLAFSIDNFPKNEMGETLRIALERLSIFISFFVDLTATQVLENRSLKNEEFDEARVRTSNILRDLWERSILEAQKHRVGNGVFYSYRFHPALRPLVIERTRFENYNVTQEIYWLTMRRLTSLAYPAHEDGGIYADPTLSTIVMDALPDLVNAVNIRPVKDKESLILLFHTAFFLNHFGEISKAQQLFELALKISDEVGDLEIKSTILHEFAHLYIGRTEILKAQKYLQEALAIDNLRGDLAAKSGTLQALASLHSLHAEFDQALKMLDEALAIQRSLVKPLGIPDILQAMAEIKIRLGKYDDGLDLLSQALDALKARKNYKSQVAILVETSIIYRRRGKIDQALKNCLEANELAEEFHLEDFKPNILYEIGKIYYERNELDDALAYYYRALELDKLNGDLQGQSAVMHGLANIYTERKEYDKAINLYTQSIEIDKQSGDKQGMAMSLIGLGETIWRKEEYEDGLRIFLDGFSMILDLNIQPTEMAGTLMEWKKQLGDEQFGRLWLKVSGRNLPEWLSKPSYQQEQEIAAMFITRAIQSAREKRPEAEQYFMYAQKMAADSNAPKELQELGRVILRVMLDNTNVDLSSLPREWAEAVRDAINI